jgi:hypothetical protein
MKLAQHKDLLDAPGNEWPEISNLLPEHSKGRRGQAANDSRAAPDAPSQMVDMQGASSGSEGKLVTGFTEYPFQEANNADPNDVGLSPPFQTRNLRREQARP